MVLFRKKIARTWKLSANTMVSKLLTFASTIGNQLIIQSQQLFLWLPPLELYLQ